MLLRNLGILVLLLAGCSAEPPARAPGTSATKPIPADGSAVPSQTDAGPEPPDNLPLERQVPNACAALGLDAGGAEPAVPELDGPCCGPDSIGPLEPVELCVLGEQRGGAMFLSPASIQFTVRALDPDGYWWFHNTSRCWASQVEKGLLRIEDTMCVSGLRNPTGVTLGPFDPIAACRPFGLQKGHSVAVLDGLCLEFDFPGWVGPHGKCVSREPRNYSLPSR